MTTAPPQANYDYSGLGKAEALLLFSLMASSPLGPVVWFTTGIAGSITFQLLWWLCTWFANKEVMVLNVAATDIQTIIQKGDFDASFNAAFKAIQSNPYRLTDAQKSAIDAPVIAAFTKFAVFGQLRDNTKSGDSSGDNTAS